MKSLKVSRYAARCEEEKMAMKKPIKLLCMGVLILIGNSFGDANDCQDLKVSLINLEKNQALRATFVNGGTSTYYVKFSNWTDEQQKLALSILLTSKTTGIGINLVTDATGGCGITTAQQHANTLNLN